MLRENRDFEVLKLSLIKSLQVPLFLKISICTNSRCDQLKQDNLLHLENFLLDKLDFVPLFVNFVACRKNDN